MSFGIECYDSTSRRVFASSEFSPCLIDTFQTVQDTAGSISYPAYAGSTIDIQAYSSTFTSYSIPFSFSIDYSLGYPRISWSGTSSAEHGASLVRYPMFVRVFVVTPKTLSGTNFGMSVTNNNNELINFIDADNMHFVGLGKYSSQTAIGRVYPATYKLTYTISSPNGVPIVFIENLAGQSATLTAVTGTAPNYTITIVANSVSIPRVFCFANLNSSTTAQQYGMSVYNGSGILKLDTTARPLTCPAYVQSVTPSFSISSGGGWYYANGVSTPTLVGTIPTTSATLCSSAIGWTWEQQDAPSGYWYFATTMLGVYRSSNVFYNNWVQINPTSSPLSYNTVFPYYYSTGSSYRIYMIDIALYT